MTIIAASLAAAGLASAQETSRTFDLSGFNRINVGTAIDVEVAVGPDYSVIVREPDGNFERLEVEVENGELELRRRGVDLFGSRNAPRYSATVTTPALERMIVSTGSDARVRGVDSESFDIISSTGSDLVISGRCGVLTANVSTGADLDARGLECRIVDINLSTGADAEVFASERVDANISTGADLDVYGGPEDVNHNRSIGGSVRVHRD
ncbi:MAG: hypothetical protein Tsb0010_14890 [Parvularculaceae bacterium]